MVHFNKVLCFFALLFIIQVTSKDMKETIFHRGMTFFGNKTDMGVAKNVTDELTDAVIDGKSKWFKQSGFGGSFNQSMTHPRNASDTKKDPACCDPYENVEIENNTFAATAGGVDECCDFCSGIFGCKAWTWINGSCYFKSVKGPTVTSIGAVTGIPCEDRQKTED